MSKNTSSAPSGNPRRRPSLLGALLRWLGFTVLCAVIAGGLALGTYVLYLDDVIRTEFENKRWALPARVYARPLELFPDKALRSEQLTRELELLRYSAATQLDTPGSYRRAGNNIQIYTRGFTFADAVEPPRLLQVSFAGAKVAQITGEAADPPLNLIRLDPVEIAGIYPSHYEDRILLKRDELPPVLVDTLVAVEDRTFFEHAGIDPKGIMRAFFSNLKAGRTVQGGSTLTQQLVKNFFLSNERTLRRKLTEVVMALLVDMHYSKDEILEAYCNEVYLGQDGSRAIHGLGLGSRFYFDRDLKDLELHQVALLIGLVNGPSRNDPRRYPERALERRALVLDVMLERGLVGADDVATAKQMPLDIDDEAASGVTSYPAFLDLVQQQLRESYRSEQLVSDGLRIFTSLDPLVQDAAEKGLQKRLRALDGGRRKHPLQGAAVVTDTRTGEVLAMVGGRDVRLAGFNRALHARRSAGSTLKPAVYLTALEQPERYNLATLLDDTKPVVYSMGGGRPWKPLNYDRRFHGRVPLRTALAHSYNIPAARVGLDMDVLRVIDTLQRLGLNRDLKPYPSLLLGAVDMSPVEMAQIYSTLASGGLRMPLRTIREVAKVNGETLQHYDLQIEKVVEPGPAYLIINAMQAVIESGTAVAVKRRMPKLHIAGKTGTTDDYRDSWFAGFSGDKLAVAWVGRDDNKPTGLSGANGALPVWLDIMSQLDLEPLDQPPPPEVEMVRVNPRSGLVASKGCRGGVPLPFLAGSVPRATGCGGGGGDGGGGATSVRTASRGSSSARKSAARRSRASDYTAQNTADAPAKGESWSDLMSPSPHRGSSRPKSSNEMGDFFKRLQE